MSGNRGAERQLAAAHLIRAYLPELLRDEEQAARVDEVLRRLLTADDRETAAARVRQVVEAHPATRTWTQQVLEDPQLRPPELQDWEERGVEPIGGRLPVPPRRFACPVDGGNVRYQRTAGQDMGICPDHGVALIPA